MELRYWFLLTALGALWGSAFMFIKVATPEFGPIGLVNARLIIASVIFLPILLRKKYLKLLMPIWRHALVLSFANCIIPFTLFSYASLGANSNILSILNATTAFATMIIAYFWLKENVSIKQIFGLLIGFISGLTGTGGGIFLSPLIVFLGWTSVKGASGTAALFILFNSTAGLLGNNFIVRSLPSEIYLYSLAVILGALIGTQLGIKYFMEEGVKKSLGVVLIIAGIKFINVKEVNW